MDILIQFLDEIQYQLLSIGSRLGILYLLITVLIAFGLWWMRGRPTSFVAWLLPARVYRHRSNLLDLKLFLTHGLLNAIGFMGSVVFTPLVTFTVLGWLMLLSPEAGEQPVTLWRSALVTLIIVLAADFVKYWAHRLHHEYAPLWSFHAVHHSADVLTPLTLSRAHPVESMIRSVGISILVGVAQAVALFTFIGQIDLLTIGGANAFYVMFNAAGANLRHSHIWLSYGRVVEHIFISPAQHQVHHSMDVKHHNKNYGSMFAIWDWMFGTLYVPPNGPEELRFGVADGKGVPIPQMHPTLRAALFRPFVDSAKSFRSRMGQKAPAPDTAPTSTVQTDP